MSADNEMSNSAKDSPSKEESKEGMKESSHEIHGKPELGPSPDVRRTMFSDVVAAPDVVAAIDELSIPMRKLSALYEAGSGALNDAVHVDSLSGETSVDREMFRKALEVYSQPLPPERLEELVTKLELGYLTRGEELIMPAFMLLEPSLTQQLDVHAWRSIGISPDMDPSMAAKAFTGLFPNAPEAVVAKKNFGRLAREARIELKRVQRLERYLTLSVGDISSRRPNGGGPGSEVLPTHVSPAVPAPVISGSYKSGLEDVEAFAKCFAEASWSVTWFGLRVCFDRTCADLIQKELVGSDWESFVLKVFQLSNDVFQNVLAGTWFGYVMAAISTAELYWALMIAANKAPGGVCLSIPAPWTFGIIGPGWAVGIP